MPSNLWSCLPQLAKSRYDKVVIQETKSNDPEIALKLQYVCKSKTNGVVDANVATEARSGVTAILLSAHTATVMSERQTEEKSLGHRIIAHTGKIHDEAPLLQSVYSPVENNQRAQFFTSLPRSTPFIHIMLRDMNCTLDPDLDGEIYMKHSNRGEEQLQ